MLHIPDGHHRPGDSPKATGISEPDSSRAGTPGVNRCSDNSAKAADLLENDDHLTETPDSYHHPDENAVATAPEPKPHLAETPDDHRSHHDSGGAAATFREPHLPRTPDGHDCVDKGVNSTITVVVTGPGSDTKSELQTITPLLPTTMDRRNRPIDSEENPDTASTDLHTGTELYPETKSDLTTPLLSVGNSDDPSSESNSDIHQDFDPSSKSDRNNIDASWMAIAKGLLLIEGRSCSSTRSSASQCESKSSDISRSTAHENELRPDPCPEFSYSHGICLDPDTGLILCMHHALAEMDPEHTVLVVHTFDEQNVQRRCSFIAKRLSKCVGGHSPTSMCICV